MAKYRQDELFLLLNLLEELEDSIDLDRYYTPFDNVVSRDKKQLVNYDKEEAEFILVLRSYIRSLVSAGISTLKIVKEVSTKGIIKAFDYNKYKRWKKELDKKIPQIERDFENKLIIPVSVSYGKGFEKAMQDLGVKPNENWIYMSAHSVPRLKVLELLRHISTDLQDEMRVAIVDGLRAGEGTEKIAKRLRGVQNAPKRVNVPPIIDPRTGETLRKGFEYNIPSRRYSQIVARTETSKAVNWGRIDAYKKSGVVKKVELLTAGDNRVCELCEPLDRQIYSLDEATSIIPVHAMCRCTWTIAEYKGDEEDRKPEVPQEVYKVDDIDKFLSSAPLGIPRNEIETGQHMDRYLAHLKAHKLHTESKLPIVYKRLRDQLKGLGVEIEDFKPTNFRQVYALHVFKNARMLVEKTTGKVLQDTTLRMVPNFQSARRVLARAIQYRDGHTAIEVGNNGIKYHLTQTSIHEMAHIEKYRSSKSIQTEYWKLYHKERTYVTTYAKMGGPEEGFAETFSTLVLNPSKANKIVPRQSDFIRKHYFNVPKTTVPDLPKIPKTPKLSTPVKATNKYAPKYLQVEDFRKKVSSNVEILDKKITELISKGTLGEKEILALRQEFFALTKGNIQTANLVFKQWSVDGLKKWKYALNKYMIDNLPTMEAKREARKQLANLIRYYKGGSRFQSAEGLLRSNMYAEAKKAFSGLDISKSVQRIIASEKLFSE